MKKFVSILALSVLASLAFADTYSYTITVTNTQHITYSDPLPISGYFEKMEVVTEAASTQTVTLATYSGTTACDTIATKAIVNARDGVQIFRTRVIGTTSAGVALAGAQEAGGTDTNVVTTVLAGVYEKPLLGGNLKLAVTGTANDGSAAVTCTIYYKPTAD